MAGKEAVAHVIYIYINIYIYIRVGVYICNMCVYICNMYMCIAMYMSYVYVYISNMYTYHSNGVATISRLLKIVGLFCKRALQKRLYSA